VFERRSALADELTAAGRDGLDDRRALRIGEVRGWELVQVAVFPGYEVAVAAALSPVFGADPLAARAGEVARLGRACLYRIALHSYWVVSSDAKVVSDLVAAVPVSAGTVTPLSHSRTRLAVEGAAARAVLAKGITIDLHPQAFPVGAFAQTGLHHAGVLLERCGEDRYELYVLRTFAVSTWQWLLDAALPFGYEIAVEQVPSV
jgi:heterotetrameric sarcosine oxidase gamma subunit